MNEATKNLFRARYSSRVSSEAYVVWAITCLEEGLDSKNLGMLAALEKPYNSVETETHFKRALAELKFIWPEEKPCLLAYAQEIAQQTVNAEIAPFAAVGKLYQLWLTLDNAPELLDWCYLSDGLDPQTYEVFIDRTDEVIAQESWKAAIMRSARKLLDLRVESETYKEIS